MSEFIEIVGGRRLSGSVRIAGAKNAALPLLMATLLTDETCSFENVPNLEDINLTLRLLEHFGGVTEYAMSREGEGKITVAVGALRASEASYSLVKALRASFWVLAPLLARGGAARVALPGGDIIGARPVDMHLAALTTMGADIKVKHGVVFATAVDGLRPAKIDLRFPSVGATHQVMMAAALTRGETVIKGAAREPEIVALAAMLQQMGALIEGAGTPQIVIQGREQLGGSSVRLIGDRVEAGTYLLAGAASGGAVRANGIAPAYFGEFLTMLDAIGLNVTSGDDWVAVENRGRMKAINAATGPFPAFATDLQAPLMAALCVAEGTSIIEENIFEGRYGHVSELCRMGAQIKVSDRSAEVCGVEKLTAAPVEAFDIRAGAALVIAALAAEGSSRIHEPHHLRRGYEALEEKLTALGAQVGCRVADIDDYVLSGC